MSSFGACNGGTMNADMKEAFFSIKPICDVLMVRPSIEGLKAYTTRVEELKKDVVQELQQYLLFPLISRLQINEMKAKEEIHLKMLEAVRMVLEKITVNSFEMYMKLETGLLSIIFDHEKAGMISDTSEEVKHATLKCLVATMLHIPYEFKNKVLRTQVPMLAQTVFVSVHIAKLEKLRALRLTAIDCVVAHTLTHPKMTVDYHIHDAALELLAVDSMLSSILPGVLAALQDVATSNDNQGHQVIAASIDAIHRILCLPMHDKYLPKSPQLRTEDFIKMVREKKTKDNPEVSKKGQKSVKDMKKRSAEWFAMAGEKLTLITKSLSGLRMHDHYVVRKELAVFCYRVLMECSTTMPASHGICLDVLISLTKDEYPEVGQYCSTAVHTYLASAAADKHKTIDNLGENFLSVLSTLPRVLNAVDNIHKLSALNLLHGYIEVMSSGRPQRLTGMLSVAGNMQQLCAALCDAARHSTTLAVLTRHATREVMSSGRPQRLTGMLSVAGNMQQLCAALCDAARHSTTLAVLTRHATRDVSAPPPISSPWSTFLHLDSMEAVRRLQETCQLLGASECSELILDSLLDQFRTRTDAEPVYICNWMANAPNASVSMARRILHTYLEQDVWYSPIEVDTGDAPLTLDDTLDVTVYNPRAWTKDSVPDLYEGAVETRYTDISYQYPRVVSSRSHSVSTTSAAQHNLVLSCLLTEGVGVVASRLKEAYQPYLLRTLCLILERVGSEYELLHLSGLKTINLIATACGHSSVGDLIKCNADYFTNKITLCLKKSWDCESALQILSVVMEYSDASILDCMYGIVEDVLVQSCDKYYEKNLLAYLQVFLTFVDCIRKWFPLDDTSKSEPQGMDLLAELNEYVEATQEAERLLSDSDFDSGKSLDEMYREDMQNKEKHQLDYDDTVTEEKPPLPQHAKITLTILQRCVHFVSSPHRDTTLLAMRILSRGLPLLTSYEDELLPLVHRVWAPLVTRFQTTEAVLLRRAFDLLVTLAAVAKDFISSRTVKEVLPEIYKFLHKSSKDSYLKDTGSYYRSSPAYTLQLSALEALPSLARDLALEDQQLVLAMSSVDPYLSRKQPKPLQTSAVNFFKKILELDYGAAWYHIRELCNNDVVMDPPELKFFKLEPIIGTPTLARDKDYDTNCKLIFDYMVS